MRKCKKYYRKNRKISFVKNVNGGFYMEKSSKGIRGEVDRRILDKMLIRKEIAPEELKQYTDSLPDLSENMEEIVVEITEDSEEERHDD